MAERFIWQGAGVNRAVLFAVFGGCVLAAPFATGPYYVNLASQILIGALFAQSLNLLVGYAGMPSFCHGALLGTSAYLIAILTAHYGVDHLTAAVIAVTATTALGAVFGAMALRGAGDVFLMITLALGQVIWGLAFRWSSMTGGEGGIGDVTRPEPFGVSLASPYDFYLFTLATTAIFFVAYYALVKSPFGTSIEGCRDQPRRMRALGYNVWLIQWISFVISSFGASVAGLMYIYYHQYVGPAVVSLASSSDAVLMVIAGGAGTLLGPVVGSALLVLLRNVVSTHVSHWIMLLGIIFILIMMYMPHGIVPWLSQLRRFSGFKRAGSKQ
jgi:branched-chain amino acid transport system permease protein